MLDYNCSPTRLGRGESGMSLMEAMTVICILSLLLVLSGTRLSPLWQKHNLRLAALEVKSRLEFIRLKAILDRADYEVRIEKNFLSYRPLNSEAKWIAHKLNEDIVYFHNRKVCKFHDNGTAWGGTVTLETKDGRLCEQVVVSGSGRVRVKKAKELECL